TGLWYLQQRAAAEREAEVILRDAGRLQEEEKWPEALAAVRRAEPLLHTGLLDQEMQQRVLERRRDLEMVAHLEDARLRRSAWAKESMDYAESDRAYLEAFQRHGLDLTLGPEEVAGRIRASAIRAQLVTALDHWAWVKDRLRPGSGEQMLSVARLADNDLWRQ